MCFGSTHPNNTVIAGHAIAASAILVTNNVGEFVRVTGLMPEALG
ncbi:type II toxin-antitoxin system VapC family toxin (plasmid) [Enterobacter hormaechei]|nr:MULTISPECIES: type II toxin-antitoxin system VapC family toxin [Enterobacter]WKW40258.1 type II toxin-antitoxin system VapC family toxin [Enterobacter mori]WLR86726.1 type II toxin-antitoxin system VapC family toxin [Enterobacter hormaechei]